MSAPDPTLRPAGHAGGLFRSFWMGGFEGADHLNSHGEALYLRRSNGHERLAASDYAALARFGIRTIRESVGWRVSSDAEGRLDLRATLRMAKVADQHGLQVIWTLLHYGHPAYVSFYDSDFAERFADFCGQTARALKACGSGPPIFQPINEISFLAWAAATTNLMHPYLGGLSAQGYDLKCRLVHATVAACSAIWAEAPDARIVHTDPVIHVIHAGHDPADEAAASVLSEEQFQAWDMLCGRLEPGLGGAPRFLDVLGANYYHSNQWLHPTNERLSWHLADPRRRPLHEMLADLWHRYRRPLFLAETGHVGDGRGLWLESIAKTALQCQVDGIPLEGVCLYPLVDRTDWEQPSRWHRSGLWDVRGPAASTSDGEGPPHRALHMPLAEQLLRWQRLVPAADAVTALQTIADASPNVESLTQILNPTEVPMNTLIVFSHLRWDFVYQRPQQLLSRLATRFSIVFVEEPVPNAARGVLERLHPCSGVEVLRPHVTGSAPGFHDDHILEVRSLLADYVKAHALNDYWLWFYTPMAVPFASDLAPGGVVYDCMDELAAFLYAPKQLLQRENALFKMADIVFTGGQSLYESKRARHSQVYCFPSSVDAPHFSGNGVTGVEPIVQARIPAGPRFGYFGVIDERVDLSLIRFLSQAHAEWQIVMVGPIAKIDPADIPQAANIHWLGQQDYVDLPAFIAGWDVCLLPFALNQATQFISPTKTLEYMAAAKPIVSTPIRDVAAQYSAIVRIAATPESFVRACEEVLHAPTEVKAAEQLARDVVLAKTSWNKTATQMGDLISALLGKRCSPAIAGDFVSGGEAVTPAAAVG